MNQIAIIILMCLSFMVSAEQPVQAAPIDYSGYEKILNKDVDENGRVNYKAILADHSALDIFITTQIENADIADFTDDEKKAFWINAYNALTLKLIVDNYPPPLGQIRGINWGRPWSVKMRAAGREITLNKIEHEILRKWDPIDPRIHFAINCASIGCPKLPNTHFAPETLNQQLDQEAFKFMNDPQKVYIKKDVLYYSAILKWFKEDFIATHGNIKEYILEYTETHKVQDVLKTRKLKTIKYDWGLNKQ